ncbi:MAG: hypothetical protein ABI051_10720 [Vicinamibacterales bacterium]
MTTRRMMMAALSGLSAAGLLTVSLLARQQPGAPAMSHDMPMPAAGMSTMTTAQKIANAMEAAPATVAARATILDWPAKEGAAPAVLRTGTNGWSCFPDMPDSKGSDPMCLDATWMKWMEAYLAHKKPALTHIGIGYMMAPGGGWASNTDPFAMQETAANHWGHHAPHMMIVAPNTASLAGMSTDPANGGPYVMWSGTPYAHIMAPTMAGAMMGSMAR